MTVRAQWESLPPDSRRRLLTILTAARTAPHAGRDNGEWERLAVWAQKHLDTPTSGHPTLEGPLLPSAVRAVLAGEAGDEAAEYVWADLAEAWPVLMTATRQVILTDLSDHDDPHLAVWALSDPQATSRVARLLARTGRTRQARRLQELERASTGREHLPSRLP